MVPRALIVYSISLFLLSTVLFAPSASYAQQSCSLEEIGVSCGEGGVGFACITAVPTPVPLNQWAKVKSTSYAALNATSLANFRIPEGAERLAFNASDPDDTDNTGKFMIGDDQIANGIIAAEQLDDTIAASPSESGYVLYGYTQPKRFDASKFLDYARSRKDFRYFTALTQLEAGRINIATASATGLLVDSSNATNFRKGPMVVVIDGDMIIDDDINDGGTVFPLAIVVTGTLTIRGSASSPVNTINAIVMANRMRIEELPDDNGGLKIKGNLLVQNEFENLRSRTDSRRPVLFVVQDPAMYIDLLPYFSTAEYEWTQIQ
jgi:hypothetical protein